MKKEIIISLIIGLLIGGAWTQFRITGEIWERKTFEDVREEAAIKQYISDVRWCKLHDPSISDIGLDEIEKQLKRWTKK